MKIKRFIRCIVKKMLPQPFWLKYNDDQVTKSTRKNIIFSLDS